MNLWVPDQPGRDSIGELPDGVRCRAFPRDAPLPSAILDAEFLVLSGRAPRLRELLADMGALRVVQTISAGVDWIRPSVPPTATLCSAKGARDAAVAEWVLAAILSSVKHLPKLRAQQLDHTWLWREPGDLDGHTVMILGYGSIGAALAARLEPFGVRIIRVARRARDGVHSADDLARLLPDAEILVVLIPLSDETDGLLSAELLALLPRGALLVNAARGRVVDTNALLELLYAARLRAVLDVTEPEPLPPEHPLWDAPGVLITPHIAGDSPSAERRAFALVGDQVRRYMAGQPLANVVASDY